MKKMKNWLRKKAAMISLSLSNVEKNALGQTGEQLSSNVNETQRHTKGQLADALINGEITQEVVDLRWRTYKILQETQGYVSKITGYDDDGYPIVETVSVDRKKDLSKIKTEPTDSYPLEIVFENEGITNGVNDVMHNKYIDVSETPQFNRDDLGNVTGATHGVIKGFEYFATSKTEKPLIITRDFFPKFNIENFTKKVHIRTINDKEKLLEFYISKYVDADDRNSGIFLNELKKTIKNSIASNLLQIKKIGFTTYKTLGSDDFLEYEYEINRFDKIVEYNGFYVIKFLSNVLIDGESILEQHRQVELDKKYENKEKK